MKNPDHKMATNIFEIEAITIGTVNKCNLQCPLCMRQNPDFISDHIQLDYKRTLAFIDRYPIKIVYLVGTLSEPMLYPDLILFAKELKKRNINIWISTNGSMSLDSTKRWEELGSILDERDKIVFAVDGPTNEIHQQYRKGSNLDTIINNVKKLKDSKVKKVCQFIKFTYNVKYLEDTQNFAKTNGFDMFYEIFTGHNHIKEFGLPFKFQTRIGLEMDTQKTRPNCKAISDRIIYINHRNQVNICDSFDEDLFTIPNSLNTESTHEEILTYYNKQYFKKCCYEYCGFKYEEQKDKLYDL